MSEFKIEHTVPRWECPIHGYGPGSKYPIVILNYEKYCERCLHEFLAKNVPKLIEITE